MRVTWIVRACVSVALLIGTGTCAIADPGCSRIVSLAPSITETLYEVGLGDRLVGVTRFCRYPSDAQKITKVGGFLDVSIEQIVKLKPSHLFALSESTESLRVLSNFPVHVVTVDHRSLKGIKEAFSIIGAACGAQQQASKKLDEFEYGERRLKSQLSGVAPRRVLVAVGRTQEGRDLSGVYVSGSDGVYSDLLKLLGAQSVNHQKTIALPTLSPEGLFSLSPDAIIEIATVDDVGPDVRSLEGFWQRYPKIPAVANDRVGVLTQPYASIPGPRYLALAEAFARVIYPERYSGVTGSATTAPATRSITRQRPGGGR